MIVFTHSDTSKHDVEILSDKIDRKIQGSIQKINLDPRNISDVNRFLNEIFTYQ
jgi:hypothetical protein